MAYQSFFSELRRRHIFRVAIAYVAAAWLLLQLGEIVFPVVHAPSWCEGVLLAFVVLGFPLALFLAWAFESTPEGVRRTVPADSEEARPEATGRKLGRKIDFLIIGVLLAAVGVLAWRQFGTRSTRPASHAAVAVTAKTSAPVSAPAKATLIPAKSIAVLPFENLSSDQANAYFAAGMQDLILTKLADIGDLKVISRTSTMQYGSHPENLSRVGEQLGVATILEGSVQRIGDQVLVNVQLINASTDSHIWAQSYTRTLKNVFGVEGEVAAKIASTLKAKLSPAESKRLATALSGDPAANDLYLRAEYFMNRAFSYSQLRQSLRQAISLYRKALAQAPNFALAYARLSYAESWLAFNGGGGEDLKKLMTDAYAQAEQAMKLAPNMAESHLAIGYYEYYGKQDYDAALKAFAAALKIRPNDAEAYAARGFVLRRQGKFEKAIEALKRALTLDPRSASVTMTLGEVYMAINRYPEAEQLLQHAIALNPANETALIDYADAIVLSTGEVSRALNILQGNGAFIKWFRANALLPLQRKYRAAIDLVNSVPDTWDLFNPGEKALTLGDLYRWSGGRAQARSYYAKALPVLRAQLPALATHPLRLASVWNEIADAELGLGKTNAGIAAIKNSLAAAEKSGDLYGRPELVAEAAFVYADAGRADKAVSLISRALATPGIGFWYSPPLLWLDPDWNPIRKSPAFQALLKKYVKYRPAKVYDGLNK